MSAPSEMLLLFPTPVMTAKVNRSLTKAELKCINQLRNDTILNYGNTSSKNTYVLDLPELKKLKKELQTLVNEYVQVVHKPKYSCIPYITQSWMNYTEKGQYHHRHSHSNSFVSGVFYIDVDEAKIIFHNDTKRQLEIASEGYDVLNATTWWVEVKSNEVLLFPSTLVHEVEKVTTDKPRISLAFNVFIKGTFGEELMMTELKLD